MPYLTQYSTVWEELLVNISWTTMKNNIAINKMLNPLKAIFNIFLIVFLLFIFGTNVIYRQWTQSQLLYIYYSTFPKMRISQLTTLY
jgi:hypothetical protein